MKRLTHRYSPEDLNLGRN